MITAWDIYWITRLDVIGNFFLCIALTPIILTAVSPIWYIVYESFDFEISSKVLKKTGVIILSIWIVGLFVSGFLPTTKEAIAIYALPKVINNEQVQAVPDNTLKLINSKLQEWINDQMPEEK